MTHRIFRQALLVTAVLVSTAAVPATAQDATDSFSDAITKGTFSLNLRYRFEDVDQDGFDDDGRASTLRTTFGYKTMWWSGLMIFAEMEDVHDIGYGGDHNNAGSGSLWNGVTDRPVIADPEITEFNQAYLGIRPAKTFIIRAGLQEIVVDNSRFVGNVGWRQNHQSFEAARVTWDLTETFALSYAYIGRTRTVTGASQPMTTHHADLGYTSGGGTLKGYLLQIDYDDEPLWGRSTSTYGAFIGGEAAVSDSTILLYRFEYAQQEDTGNNPNRVDAGYRLANLGLRMGKWTVAASWEVLEGDPDSGAFTTPLATLHKFNGWADKFLSTPGNGLEDLYLTVGAKLGRWDLTAVYHDFTANSGDGKWGTEIDAHVIYTAKWKQKFALKAALYEADEWATDTTKIWLWTSWGF